MDLWPNHCSTWKWWIPKHSFSTFTLNLIISLQSNMIFFTLFLLSVFTKKKRETFKLAKIEQGNREKLVLLLLTELNWRTFAFILYSILFLYKKPIINGLCYFAAFDSARVFDSFTYLLLYRLTLLCFLLFSYFPSSHSLSTHIRTLLIYMAALSAG